MALPVISFIIALVATVLAFIFVVPEKCRATLNGFGKFLHDLFNFKFLIVEKILQFCYILLTAFTIIYGFFLFFQTDYYGDWIGYIGLLTMILGPISIRIFYEFTMLAIIAIKNIIQINNKIKNQNTEDSNPSSFNLPQMNDYNDSANVANAAPQACLFCSECGYRLDAEGRCTNPNCNK